MVHWIYVLECEDDYLYVGETTRLFRRFKEHQTGRGGMNTGSHKPDTLVALYKVADNYSFLEHRSYILQNQFNKNIIDDWGSDDSANLEIENHITEMFMYQRDVKEDDGFLYGDGRWDKVKGGKYTKYMTKNPTLQMNAQNIIDRPNCHCQIPCEVKMSKDKKTIYFVCPLKNVWDDFYSYLSVDEPCDFYSVYTDDKIIRVEYEIAKKNISEEWVQRMKSTSCVYPDPCIKCKNTKYAPFYSWYQYRPLCRECIVNKYEELKKEYSLSDYAFVD
jgi:predicted GIY-YIG superfamily endonuclease